MVGLVQHLLSTAPGVLVLCPFAMGLRTKLDNMLDWATEELVELRSLRPEAQQLIIDALNECNGAGESCPVDCTEESLVTTNVSALLYVSAPTDDSELILTSRSSVA